MKIRKRVVGLVLAGAMLVGSTMSVFAAGAEPRVQGAYDCAWKIAAYPGKADSQTYTMIAKVNSSTCKITCTSYKSSSNQVITFKSSNFMSNTSISGLGTLTPKKRNTNALYVYDVTAIAPAVDASGAGRIVG